MRASEHIRQQVGAVLSAAGLREGEGLVVAVSGGADSMVLLDALLGARPGLQAHVAHLDHGLRPDSPADAHFVQEEARRRGLPCTCVRRDVEGWAQSQKRSVEEAGRQLRYDFFDEVARQVRARFIALGHHADDQAETVLLRLLRGSGTTGLGGMEALREGRYMRPLLACSRAQIRAYAKERGLAFREDPSNCDRRFLRNRVRHELLPGLRQYNPQVDAALQRTAGVLRAEDHFLGEAAAAALQAVICAAGEDKIVLDASRLVDYHIAVQRRVARALFQGLSAGEGPFDFDHVEHLLDVARRPEGRLCSLPAGLCAQRSGSLLVVRRGRARPVDCRIAVPGEMAVPGRDLALVSRLLPADHFGALRPGLGGARAAFDAERLGPRPRLRSLCPGDRFQPLGMQGRKKVSDLLVDEKWPRILRDEVLVLEGEGDIAWIVGLRPAHPFRVRSSSRQIALVDMRGLECATFLRG